MDVILMQNVDNLGRVGETVSVAAGYARNFLIPKGMAVVASEGQRRVVEQHIAREAKRDLERKSDAELLAGQIGELSCTITVQADDEEKLYGSVGPREIAAAIVSDKVQIDHHMVVLPEPIKQLGVYTVPIRLHHDVQVEAKVWVVKA
jgi:large subunit ribosomal protein L9